MWFKNAEQYATRLSLIFHGVIAIPLVLFAYLYLEATQGGAEPILKEEFYVRILRFITIPLSGICAFWAYTYLKKSRRSAPKPDELRSKLNVYYQIALKRYAFSIVSVWAPVIAYYLTFDFVHTILFILALVAMSFHRPDMNRLDKHLKLTEELEAFLRYRDREIP